MDVQTGPYVVLDSQAPGTFVFTSPLKNDILPTDTFISFRQLEKEIKMIFFRPLKGPGCCCAQCLVDESALPTRCGGSRKQ